MGSKMELMSRLKTMSVLACYALIMTTNVADAAPDYDTEIQPIFDRSCDGASCHIDREASGVELTNYDSVKASVGRLYDTAVVAPGDPDASPLYDKVASENPENGTRMPLVGDYLPADELDLLREWILAGALPSSVPERGDANGDKNVDISDAVLILNFLFAGEKPPVCGPVADANSSGALQISDAVFLLNFLFSADSPAPKPLDPAEVEECRAG